MAAYYLTATKYALPREFILALPAVMLVLSLLMLSRLPIPKLGLRKNLAINIFVVGNAVLFYICGILWRYPEYLLTIGVLYLFGGGGWAVLTGVKPPPLESTIPPAGDEVL